MKYTCEVEIELPRARVLELFDNVDNMKHWQPGLVSFTHLEGTPGQVGAKSKLVYAMGSRTVEMIETITERNLPSRFCGTYDAGSCVNHMVNNFDDLGSRTRWTAEAEFIMGSFLMRVMGFLMPGMFKKETQKFMTQFKNFAESQGPS
jgi:carbon monoxide dehydrogenase subunit G